MALSNQMFRSKLTADFVREEIQRDGKIITIRATLPIGRGWQGGQGAIDWINLGWRSADEYDAAQNSKKVEEERKAAIKAAEEKAEDERKAAAKAEDKPVDKPEKPEKKGK